MEILLHPLYLEGLALYRSGQYWLSHESWEDLWKQSTGPERHLLQALIQLDAALIQSERGKWNGAATLLDRCLSHLDSAGNPLPQLREQVAAIVRGAPFDRPLL